MSLVDSMPAAPAAPAHRIAWVHPPGGFLGLSLLNGLLRIITLGVYHFWGKTEVRQRIWSAIRIDGEPLEYRGTGGELFRGFIIVFFCVLLPLGLITFVAPLLWGSQAGRGGFEILIWAIVFSLWGFGIHRARRYRLSRTRWRGIRAGLSGRSGPFAWTYLWTTLLIPLTLGWILPWRAVKLQKVLFDETHFGDKAFQFTGRAGPLYKRFWLVWVSAIVLIIAATTAIVMLVGVAYFTPGVQRPPVTSPYTRGIIAAVIAIIFMALLIFAMIRAWYSSRMFNYFASETTYLGRRFHLTTTVPSLVWLVATNYLIRVLSLTILSPIAEARATRYIVDRLTLEGPLEWQTVAQNPDALLKSGEGLAEAFNVDAF